MKNYLALFIVMFLVGCTSTRAVKNYLMKHQEDGQEWTVHGGDFRRYNYTPVTLTLPLSTPILHKYRSALAKQPLIFKGMLILSFQNGKILFLKTRKLEKIGELKLSYGMKFPIGIKDHFFIIPTELGNFGIRVIDSKLYKEITKIGKLPVASDIVIKEDEIGFVDIENNFILAHLTTGNSEWRFHLDGYCSSSPVLEDYYLYLLTENGYLYKINWLFRKVVWKQKLPGIYANSPLIMDSIMVCLSKDGYGIVLKKKDGSLLLQKSDMPPIIAPMAYHPQMDIMIVGSLDHNVYAIHPEDLKVAWNINTGSIITAQAFLTHNMGIVGSWDKQVYLFSFDGKIKKKLSFDRPIKNSVLFWKRSLYIPVERKGLYKYEEFY